jgi:hypothetical protein
MSAYFSLSDILAEEERVPCAWHVAAKGVGYLDPSGGSEVRRLPSGPAWRWAGRRRRHTPRPFARARGRAR